MYTYIYMCTYLYIYTHTHIYFPHMPRIFMSRHPSSLIKILGMGWLPLIAPLKLYVSFAEYRLFYGALLQKRPFILRSLLIVPPHANARWVTSKTTRCIMLQHTAIHCNILLQHTAKHCNILRIPGVQSQKDTYAHCFTLCNTSQHTATHCNTL